MWLTMAKWATSGLDVNAAIQRLCKRHGTEAVLQHLRDWVAYMDGQIAIMEKHQMLHNDGLDAHE
jgi:hypothetical protein